jgi:hypothetical protein
MHASEIAGAGRSAAQSGHDEYPLLGEQGGPADLRVSLDRELPQKIVELEGGRLPTFENGFDDGGREQGDTQDAAEVGFVDGFGFGEITDGGVIAGFRHLARAVGADDGLDDSVVDAKSADRQTQHACWLIRQGRLAISI